MARQKADELNFEDLVKGISGLRKDVRLIRVQMLSQFKPAFTNQETMEMFGIASSTLKMWRDTGILGYSQIGKIYLYSREDIDKFLKDHHYDTFDNTREFVRSLNK